MPASGIAPPQTPLQWVSGIYRPNTVITVIGLRYRPRPISVCSVVALWRPISRKPEFRITKVLCQLLEEYWFSKTVEFEENRLVGS